MIMFSNSDAAINMRLALAESNYDTAEFWLGISLGISVRMNYCEDVLSINHTIYLH